MAMTLRTARMHPALHVDSERILVGRVTDDGLDYQLVDSDRKIVSAGDVEDDLIFVPRPYQDLAGRRPGDDVTAFLAGAEAPPSLRFWPSRQAPSTRRSTFHGTNFVPCSPCGPSRAISIPVS